MVEQYNLKYEHEWFQGFSNSLSFSHQLFYATEHVPFAYLDGEGNASNVNSLSSSEFNLHFHFAYKEKFMLGKFERKSLGSKYPIVNFDLTYSPKNLLNNKHEYVKLRAQIRDKVELNPFGHNRYWLTMGKIYGNVPYPFHCCAIDESIYLR